MSNLGFQTIYRHLNALPDVVCERVFLPDPADVVEMERTQTAPFSLESQRPLTDFHLVGFSVTYEGDYINVLRILDLAGIPLRASERRSQDPLVLMGGVCAFSNPEPVAPFMDFIVVGEGEELVGELIDAYRERYQDREASSTAASPHRRLRARRYDRELRATAPGRRRCARRRARRRHQAPAARRDAFRTIAAVKTPNAEYGHMALLEVGKGCGAAAASAWRARCTGPCGTAAWSARGDDRAAGRGGEKRIGLVGACVSDYPVDRRAAEVRRGNGMELSISSLRADSLTEDLGASLAAAATGR
jgi:hypothetical protein